MRYKYMQSSFGKPENLGLKNTDNQVFDGSAFSLGQEKFFEKYFHLASLAVYILTNKPPSIFEKSGESYKIASKSSVVEESAVHL